MEEQDNREQIEIDSSNSNKKKNMRNWLIILMLAVCVVLWFIAPFVAINYAGWGDQPTALQLVTGDFFYIGDLEESSAFWVAIITIVGIVVCLITEWIEKNKWTVATAVITEIPLLYVLYEMLQWADDGEELMEILGIGFWMIMIIVLLIIVYYIYKIASKKANSPTNS